MTLNQYTEACNELAKVGKRALALSLIEAVYSEPDLTPKKRHSNTLGVVFRDCFLVPYHCDDCGKLRKQYSGPCNHCKSYNIKAF